MVYDSYSENQLKLTLNSGIDNNNKFLSSILKYCHMQVHLFGNYIPTVLSSPNCTSPPSMAATFLVTCLTVVLQPSRYFVFHSRDTPI